ncbi:MAG TPA: diaminopimelate epimerase [Solirubrobacteraceae bacterium]|nr:diaminopimelate epimerase [Solirubrobacteraceae bacterium]
MTGMRFEKWQALGNDYVIVERDGLPFELTPARVRKLCAEHVGVGADGVLLLARPHDPAAHVAELRIFNPDGSEAELSGNGAREAILYLRRRGWTDADTFVIQTIAGDIRPTITGKDTCTVDMGKASLTSKDFPGGPQDGQGTVTSGGRLWAFRHVSIGNPQCAIHVESPQELRELDLQAIGPAIEASAQFPNRTNVSFFTETTPDIPGAIRARIFERGVGETLSSGTGASGAAVAHALLFAPALRPSRVTVALDGGELEVEVGEELQVKLTGWARPVFKGTLSEDFEKELHETE